MKKFLSIFTVASFLTLLFLLSSNQVKAQAQWAQCPDGASITRCETYDCPNGDTNKDGTCTKDDQGARLTDSRNDSFCANPLSGCGEVRYYKQDGTNACSVRVKETGNNCDLYNAGSPNFTPVPTISATTSPSPTPTGSQTKGGMTASPTASPSASPATKGGETLPETGPSIYWVVGIAAMGFAGLYLKGKFEKS